MAHTCRESCGVCGFLSPHNKEVAAAVSFRNQKDFFQIQELEGASYTEFSGGDFDCGRNKKLCEINGVPCDQETDPGAGDASELKIKDKNEATSTDKVDASVENGTNDVTVSIEEASNEVGIEASLVDLRQGAERPAEVFSSVDEKVEKPFCGATIITDRWAVSAAHCYDSFASADKKNVVRIREGTEYEETVEVRKVYRHPDYRYPRLYNDVAVLELGRRIEYNFKRS